MTPKPPHVSKRIKDMELPENLFGMSKKSLLLGTIKTCKYSIDKSKKIIEQERESIEISKKTIIWAMKELKK